MRQSAKILLAAALGLGLAGAVMSCNRGPAEKAGEKIDKAVDKTAKAARDVKDDITKSR